jgi:D-lyxose ketol-isomerase
MEVKMILSSEVKKAQKKAADFIKRAGIHITGEEINNIDTVDFGLNHLDIEGAEILTMVQTDRISVKLLVLFPNQTEPEHWHPPFGNDPGKEETVRVVWGTVFFYIDGTDTLKNGIIPHGKETVYTMRHELVLNPGDQITCLPGEKHWFQAGSGGAVLYSFSSVARDGLDGFTDSDINRITKIIED